MKKPWHLANPALLARIQDEVGKKYPDLQLVREGDIVWLRGSFPVVHDGKLLDRYQIEIELTIDWPDSCPILREVGGRIPRLRDRHMNADGTACPIVPEEWTLNPQRDSLVSFLEGPVHNFLLGQSLVELGESWPFGERKHGWEGLLESYGELVGTSDLCLVIRYLDVLSKEEIRGHLECPCGSRKRIRDCHRTNLLLLRQKIPRRIAAQALSRLQEQLSK